MRSATPVGIAAAWQAFVVVCCAVAIVQVSSQAAEPFRAPELLTDGGWPHIAVFCRACSAKENGGTAGFQALVMVIQKEVVRIGGTLWRFSIGEGTVEHSLPGFEAATNMNLTLIIVFTNLLEPIMDFHEKSPNTRFLFTNDLPDVSVPWLKTLRVRWDEIGYLAGYIAGRISETDKVMMLSAGSDIRNHGGHKAGFLQGLRDACPTCEAWVPRLRYQPGRPDYVTQHMARAYVAHGITTIYGISPGNHELFLDTAVAENSRVVGIAHLFTRPHGTPYTINVAFLFGVVDSIRQISEHRWDALDGSHIVVGMSLDAVGFFGCNASTLFPCEDVRPSPPRQIQHELATRMSRSLLHPRGIILDEFGVESQNWYPELHPARTTIMSKAYGPHEQWTSPLFATLGRQPVHNWKILVLDGNVQRVTTYDAIRNHIDPWHVKFGPAAVAIPDVTTGATFTGMTDFGLIVCGVQRDGTGDGVYKMVHDCGAFIEGCTTEVSFERLNDGVRRQHHATAPIGTDAVLVYGGLDALGERSRAAHVFNITLRTWTPVADGPEARSHQAAAMWCADGHDDLAVFVGGYTPASLASVVVVDTVAMFNVRTRSWSEVSGGPGGVVKPCVFAWREKLYVFGGLHGSATHTWVLDRRTLSWAAHTSPDVAYPSDVALECGSIPTAEVTTLTTTAPVGVPHQPAVMHKVFYVPINGSATISSRALRMRTIPSINCSDGLWLSADGHSCTECPSCVDSSASPTNAIIAASVVAVVAFVGITGVVVFMVRQKHSTGPAAPTENPVTVVVMDLHYIPTVLDDSQASHEVAMMAAYRTHCASHGVYEVTAFATRCVIACRSPAEAASAVATAMRVLAAEFGGCGVYPTFSLHTDEFDVCTSTTGRVMYLGDAWRTVRALETKCPPWTATCSHQFKQQYPVQPLDLRTGLVFQPFGTGFVILQVGEPCDRVMQQLDAALVERKESLRKLRGRHQSMNALKQSRETEVIGLLMAELLRVISNANVYRKLVRAHGLDYIKGKGSTLRRTLCHRVFLSLDRHTQTFVASFGSSMAVSRSGTLTITQSAEQSEEGTRSSL